MNTSKFLLFVIICVIFITAGSTKAQNPDVVISPAEANMLIEKDTTIVIVDVRTLAEFNSEAGHLKNAVLIPVGELESRMQELENVKDRTILVYCRSGHRSGIAAEILQKYGFKVRNLQGGINHWKAENLPIVQESTQ
jgi:rhodanese-related sulfurtransferase